MDDKYGYIYVMTNESLNEIKIGYTDHTPEERARSLSNTSVPQDYKVYCSYKVPKPRQGRDPDKYLHELISTLNPELRTRDNREFFKMKPEEAYNILYCIAMIHGDFENLQGYEELSSDDDITENTLDLIFPVYHSARDLYDKLAAIMPEISSELILSPTKNSVSLKYHKWKVAILLCRPNSVEMFIRGNSGELKDPSKLTYDVSSRNLKHMQYGLVVTESTDIAAVKELLRQSLDFLIKEKKPISH